jgi:hypothetical protein
MSTSTSTKSSSRPRGQAARALAACGVAIGSIAGCGKDSTPASPAPPLVALPLIATHPLTIQEPSDLAIDETGTILWTVTNHPEKVYQLDLDGNVTKTLSYVGNDLEGVAYDARDHTLWIAEENLRQVVHLDLDGAVLSQHSLALTGEHNSGLEGILPERQRNRVRAEREAPGPVRAGRVRLQHRRPVRTELLPGLFRTGLRSPATQLLDRRGPGTTPLSLDTESHA